MLLSLQFHHIVDLYVWVDQVVPKPAANPLGGRPQLVSPSELVTILVWGTLVGEKVTLKSIYDWVKMYHWREFPHFFSTYQGFVKACHRTSPACLHVLRCLLCTDEPVRLVDSTMVPVCKLQRSDDHKVARSVAKYGKNHQGWHYGFKLHAATSRQGALCAVALTSANAWDAHLLIRLVNEDTHVAVGDSAYGGRVMRGIIWEQYGCAVITPPHWTQRRKLATPWQNQLLSERSKIEAVFDILKNHLHLVTSFARSLPGYLLHYLRILISYQLVALASF